jgi:MFS superfamily sulfate permease-like transporter
MAAIGIILIMKQLPHLIGYDANFEGDENFQQLDNENTFSELLRLLDHITPGAILIGAISICVLILWEMKSIKKSKILSSIPAPLLVVILSVLLNYYFKNGIPNLSIQQKHLVSLPVATDVKSFMSFLTFPEFKFVTNTQVWIAAFTIAVVGSLERLLGIDAVDKLDPLKRISPTNRELKAQGIGNLISGFLGGLPLTSVVVRSSANVNSGAQTKASTIMHGLLMLICVAFIPSILNLIPLSALAAILIFTGYKLSKVSLFQSFYKNGWDQFVPFVVTIIAILLTDLLKGICVGWAVGLFYMIRSNFRSAVFAVHDKNHFLIRFRKDVSFLNKPIIKRKLNEIPSDAFLIIDVSKANFIDKDIVEEINNFILNASSRNIKVEIKESHLKSGDKLFTQS